MAHVQHWSFSCSVNTPCRRAQHLFPCCQMSQWHKSPLPERQYNRDMLPYGCCNKMENCHDIHLSNSMTAFAFMQRWVCDVTEKDRDTQGGQKVNWTNLKLSAADRFVCSLLKRVVSFQEQCLLWADWLGFIDILCVYQHAAVVRVPLVLADNTATPFLPALIIIQSGTPRCRSRRALSDHAEANGTVILTHFI